MPETEVAAETFDSWQLLGLRSLLLRYTDE